MPASDRSGIPAPWLDRLIEWPSSVRWMERLAGDAVRRLDDLPIAPHVGRAALIYPAAQPAVPRGSARARVSQVAAASTERLGR